MLIIKLVYEMTYDVLSGTLNHNHSLIVSVSSSMQKLLNRFSQNSVEMWHVDHVRNH